MAAHWSTQVYQLWWRDKGTGRARVSFAKAKESLLRRAAKVWHKDMDAALYAPGGERIPLANPTATAKKKPRKPKGATATPEPEPAAA